MEQNQFFATAKPVNLFFKVAIPGLISMLAMSFYLAFEGVFVGQWVGKAAFAAITVGLPIVSINNALADLVGVGSSAPISVALGRKEYKKANNIFTCSIILIISMAAITGIIIYFAAPWFINIMGAEGDFSLLAVKYVRVYALMGPFSTVVFAVDNYMRISGFVKGSMWLNIFMSALTVGLLALFLGVFKMSVEGAALASTVAMFTCAVIAFIPFVKKKAVLKFAKPQFNLPMVKDIFACGIPTFLNNVAGRITAIIMNSALIRLGNEVYGDNGAIAVAAYGVLLYVSGVIEPMLYGMCDSVQPSVGYNWGAGNLKRVAGITKVSFSVCGAVSALCAAVMFVFPKTLASIFVDAAENPELMALSVHAIPYFGLAFILGWFCFAVQGFFAAIEKPIYATIVSITFAIVAPITLIYALSPMGLNGLWLNYFGRSLISGIVAVILILIAQKSMKKDIMKHKTSEMEVE